MRSMPILFALGGVVAAFLVAGPASALCCNIDHSPCTVSTSSPDPHCAQGQEKDGFSWDFWECVAAGVIDPFGGAGLAAYCGAIYASEPSGCQAFDHSGSPELANGIDDDCDGQYLGDEACNGIDDDGDGRVDEDAGACLERHLFVPVCWEGSESSFNEKVSLQTGYFYDRMRWERGLAPVLGEGRKFWDTALSPDVFSWCEGDPTRETPDIGRALEAVKEVIDLRDYDTITYMTDVELTEPCVAGFTDTQGTVFARATGYLGEFGVFVHEYGHIMGLDEEYMEVSGSNNPLHADYGCDPTSCCVHPHVCSWLDGHRCLGNLAVEFPAGWNWGDALPTVLGTGRSIMSNAGAPGAETTDPTGIASTRDWDTPSLEHLQSVVLRVDDDYGGDRRRLEVAGRVDADGNIFLTTYDIEDGRTGYSNATSGAVEVVITDPATAIEVSRFSVEPRGSDPGNAPDYYYFWHRRAVDGTTEWPLTVTVIMDGTPTSQATPGGQPPVPVVNDVTQECASPQDNLVILDGSASYDPEGDTFYARWDAPVELDDPESLVVSGSFPRGDSAVTLTLVDGAGGEASETVQVSIVDTTPPELEVQPVSAITRCGSGEQVVTVRAPVVSDACSNSVDVSGQVISSSNPELVGTPVLDGANVSLPIGSHTIRWTATDEAGWTTTATQDVDVRPAIHALQGLRIQPNVHLNAGGGQALVFNGGTALARIEPDVFLGDLWSRGSVDLRDRVHAGDVYSSGTITLGNAVSTGDRRTGVPVWSPPSLEIEHVFPGTTSGDRNVEPDRVLAIAPGSYGAVRVASRSRLVLEEGDYSFVSLTLEPQARVVFTPVTGERVNIAVRDYAILRGAWQTSDQFTLAYFGQSDLHVEVPFSGQIYAPNATCYMKSASQGAITAKVLVFEAGVTYSCREAAAAGLACVEDEDCGSGDCVDGTCAW